MTLDAETSIETLSVEPTFWEKTTILHALHHGGKMRDGLSRHYHEMLMLDRAGITAAALADPALLEQVVRNKSVMFADASASYATAVLGTLRLTPSAPIRPALATDYAAMADMFMVAPPASPNCWTDWPTLRRASTRPAQRAERSGRE